MSAYREIPDDRDYVIRKLRQEIWHLKPGTHRPPTLSDLAVPALLLVALAGTL